MDRSYICSSIYTLAALPKVVQAVCSVTMMVKLPQNSMSFKGKHLSNTTFYSTICNISSVTRTPSIPSLSSFFPSPLKEKNEIRLVGKYFDKKVLTLKKTQEDRETIVGVEGSFAMVKKEIVKKTKSERMSIEDEPKTGLLREVNMLEEGAGCRMVWNDRR